MIQGFRASFTRPLIGLAEIAWRWTLGLAGIVLLGLSCFEYLDSLPVTEGDLLFLRSRQPFLIIQAVAHILRGSASRLVAALIILALGMIAAWIVVGSLGRALTVRGLLEFLRAPGTHDEQNQSIDRGDHPIRTNYPSLLGLNFLRAALMLSAIVAFCAISLFLPVHQPSFSPAIRLSLLIGWGILVWIACSTVNWFLVLAAVFAVRDARDSLASISAAVNLFSDRPGALFSVGALFGLAHFGAFCMFSSFVSFPLALAPIAPWWLVAGGIGLVTLLYFALVDFLYIARLAAFVAIVESPAPPLAALITTVPPEPTLTSPAQLDPGLLGIGG